MAEAAAEQQIHIRGNTDHQYQSQGPEKRAHRQRRGAHGGQARPSRKGETDDFDTGKVLECWPNSHSSTPRLLNFSILDVCGPAIRATSPAQPAAPSRDGIPTGRADPPRSVVATGSQSEKLSLEQLLTLPRLRKNFKLYFSHAFAWQRHREVAVSMVMVS